MKRMTILLLLPGLFQLLAPAWAISKLPPPIPVAIVNGSVVASLAPLLADTSDVEITEITLCQQYGSQCFDGLWRVHFPPGWRSREVELFGHYPGAVVKEERPASLRAGGSYVLRVFFHERGWWKKQTVSNTLEEFCLIEVSGALRIQDAHACAARRVEEDRSSRQQKGTR